MSGSAERIPRTVWVLGAVSLFMDMSSELIHAVLPMYLTTVMGLSVLAVGIIEGLAEATASMLKVVSGFISDRFASRKPLALLGYGLAALMKPVFPLADTALGVVTARVVDRIGKGIRGAPRDAIVADVTPPALRDAAFGLRQSLDTVGAFAGPMLAVLFLWLWAGDLRSVLWVASVPAFVAVALLAFGVREPAAPATSRRTTALQLAALAQMPRAFWSLIAITALFSLARLSEAFLVLRAQELGFGIVWIPLVMVVMSLVYALSSYPAGLLAARVGRKALLGASLAALTAAATALALWPGPAGLWLGVAFWGLHMGLSQGGLSAAVADLAPVQTRATAFGLFHFTTGVFQLASGALGGWLWVRYGSSATFVSGACWAAAAGLTLLVLAPSKANGSRERTP